MTRAAAVAAALVLAPALAGCIGGEDESAGPTAVDPAVIAASVKADGAVVEAAPFGAIVTWTGTAADLYGTTVTIPAGVTRVDAFLEGPEDVPLGLGMINHGTGRPRCQVDVVTAWDRGRTGIARCSGLTVVDPLPVEWETRPFGGVAAGDGPLGPGEAADLTMRLELHTGPLDGPAAAIRLDTLSMPRFDQLATETLTIPASSDGAGLFLELTRPDTDAPVPAIVISSPYNDATRSAGLRPQDASINDWVPRGYAVVAADVRGFGQSGGCVEVWGPNEQKDQVDIVEWAAEQPWSDGHVGFYGQSYVGTTPVAAAALGAPHLDAIIAVAPVIDAYFDWHFGGVPNGENSLSPASYQTLGLDAQTDAGDPLATALRVANGVCDPTLTARANDPRAVYDAFYQERNFSAKAADVKAAVLYTQGFIDSNVKPRMIDDWFNALAGPKLGVFGPWVHQHPPRADQELLFHAWFDEFLMGRDTGVRSLPQVLVTTNVDTHRGGGSWPPADAGWTPLHLDAGGAALTPEPAAPATAQILAAPALGGALGALGAPTSAWFSGDVLTDRLYLAGDGRVRLKLTAEAAETAYVAAFLYDESPDGERALATFGMRNLALRHGYDTYEPVAPGATDDVVVPLLPTEWAFEAGHRLVLELRGAEALDWAAVGPPRPAAFTIATGGDSGTALLVPTLFDPQDVPLPSSVGPVLAPAAT